MQEVLHVHIIMHGIMYTIQYIVEKMRLMVKRVRLKEMEGMWTHNYCTHKYLQVEQVFFFSER